MLKYSLFIFYFGFCYSDILPSSSPIFDFVLNNIDCGCNRVSDLNVSEIIINMRNYETNGSAAYNIKDAASAIRNRLDFDKTQPISMSVPGFRNGETKDMWCHFSKVTYNGRKPLVIIPDHSAYTDGNITQRADLVALYKRAVNYTKSIGVELGMFLSNLTEDVERSLIDVLGHSLGAHMVGYIGEVVYNKTGTKLEKIYGADPAGPCYTACPNENFRSGQADTTIAFHCNSGEYGTTLRVSDYEFVSDDGKTQSSCGTGVPELVITYLQAKCSHLKCVPIILYPELYRNQSLWQGTKCTSYDNYKDGSCNGNKTALGGYGITPEGEHGEYYFTPFYNLTCDTVLKEILTV